VPCARLSWPYRELFSVHKYISCRIVNWPSFTSSCILILRLKPVNLELRRWRQNCKKIQTTNLTITDKPRLRFPLSRILWLSRLSRSLHDFTPCRHCDGDVWSCAFLREQSKRRCCKENSLPDMLYWCWRGFVNYVNNWLSTVCWSNLLDACMRLLLPNAHSDYF